MKRDYFSKYLRTYKCYIKRKVSWLIIYNYFKIVTEIIKENLIVIARTMHFRIFYLSKDILTKENYEILCL